MAIPEITPPICQRGDDLGKKLANQFRPEDDLQRKKRLAAMNAA
jgi:hypothetical protein